MQAISAVTDRIMQIQARIAALSPTPAWTSAPGASTGALTFDQVLGSQMASPAASTAGGINTGAALMTSSGVPIEFQQKYTNGNVPAGARTALADFSGQSLWGPAARSFDAMVAAAKADGISLKVTDSYRAYETQVRLAEQKGLYSQGGLAAEPGTSKHGWAVAVDLGLDSAALAWMRQNGARFGFVEDTPREPWHWGYHPTS